MTAAVDKKLGELKQNQELLGKRLKVLQDSNVEKDKEADEIRKLIKECQENMTKIRDAEIAAAPVQEHEPEEDCGCAETVTCKVDLQRQRVRIKGPPEDLKNLDAVQMIALLEKYKCQELVLVSDDNCHGADRYRNKGIGTVTVWYPTHLGNAYVVLVIALLGYLISSPLEMSSCRMMQTVFCIIYTTCSAAHYGLALWMVLIRASPCEVCPISFNKVDNIVLERHFRLCATFSFVALISFVLASSPSRCESWPVPIFIQVGIQTLVFISALVMATFIVPPLIKIRESIDGLEVNDCLPKGYNENLVTLKSLEMMLKVHNYLTAVLLGATVYGIASRVNLSPPPPVKCGCPRKGRR